jgi:hypothetical protein|tara:strand:+ start:381 stop:1160 length:780 start_codon:yes stop_codon:yes gene_type:complete
MWPNYYKKKQNMAISVDKIYKTVLTILNREQRGQLTPGQFNKLAQQAQLEILEKTFYDYNRVLSKSNVIGSNDDYGDLANNIKEKIDHFLKLKSVAIDTTNDLINLTDNVTDLYRLISIYKSDNLTQFEEIKISELPYVLSSKLISPSSSYPIYYRQQITDGSNLDDAVKLLPSTLTGNVNIHYIKIPNTPSWNASNSPGPNNSITFSSANSTNFELHPSEEPSLITKILSYVGVVIKDPLVLQSSSQQEQNKFNKENI